MAVYLDNNATTALDEAVLQAMLPYMGKVAGNPSSVHRFGRLQKDAIEQARESVAQLVGARAEQVIFTSGGTESNNLLLNGFNRANKSARIVISQIEHMSLLEPSQHLAEVVDLVAVNEAGCVELSALMPLITDKSSLVSVMTANNETGVIQSLAPLIAFARQQGCYFHTDATQAAGKIPLNFIESGVHAMTVSAHKLYGPVGAGALVIDKQLPIAKLQFGGTQEKNMRAGTENVPAIVGFGKAAELALANLEDAYIHLRALRDALEQKLKTLPSVKIFAEQSERLPNTVQFGVEGFDGETLLMQLDRKAIAVSSGSACTSGKTEPSHVLKAMNIKQPLASSAIRVSFGKYNTMSDVDALFTALADIIDINQHSSVMLAANV
ncbi:MAG: cysteine desulfurase family protein [Gammaproteobacteria bacterium]|nr:cysteine desulfurase family protein [Gammaproteobacteria bacterium]